MVRAVLLSPMLFVAFALENGVILQERSGADQPAHPVILSTWFMAGEFAAGHCAQPRIDGEPAAVWQCTPKTWWRDGRSAPLAIAAVANPVSTRCDRETPCPTPYVRVVVKHGFLDGERVTISGARGATEINGTWTVIDRDDAGFSLAGLARAKSYAGGGVAAGPANGSLRHAIFAFPAALKARGERRVDFIGSEKYCHLGGQRVCEAAALTKAQMLAFNESRAGAGDGWGASMEAGAEGILAPGATRARYTISARQMLADWNGVESECGVRYWLRGPVATQVIVEDRCLGDPPRYDFGWKYPEPARLWLGSGPLRATDTRIRVQKGRATGWNFEKPVLAHVRRGASSNEMVRVCGIDTAPATHDELLVCEDGQGGRGHLGSKPQGFPIQGIVVSAIQARDPEPGNRQLHPYFMLTFPSGWRGVKIDYIVENTSITRLGGAWFSWTLRAGAALDTVKFKTGVAAETDLKPAEEFWMNTASRIRKTFWDGRDPDWFCEGGSGQDPCKSGTRAMRTRIDHNLPYKIAAGLLPPIDLDTRMPTGGVWEREYRAFLAGDRGDVGVSRHYPQPGFPGDRWRIQGLSNFHNNREGLPNGAFPERDMPSGEQEEGGVLPRRLARFVASWDNSDYGWEILFGTSVPGGGGLAAAAAHIPVHYRETDAVRGRGLRPFTTATSGRAFGRPLSIDARPSIYVSQGRSRIIEMTEPPDRPGLACGSPQDFNAWCYHEASMDGMTLDQAHQHLYAHVVYAITGDYYWLEELQFWAAANLAWKNPEVWSPPRGYPIGARRRRDWGYQSAYNLIRVMTWPLLTMVDAAAQTPNVPQFGASTMPELHYFQSKLARQFQIEEGRLGIRNGHFPWMNADCSGVAAATTNDPSCWGFLDQGRGFKNELPVLASGERIPGNDTTIIHQKTDGYTNTYQYPYYYAVLDRMRFLGFPHGEHVLRKAARYALGRVLNKDANPAHVAAYREANRAKETCEIGCEPGNPFFQTFREVTASYTPEVRQYKNFSDFGGSREAIGSGYVNYWRGGLALLTDFTDDTSPGCTPLERPPRGCAGQAAFDLVDSMMRFKERLPAHPKWNFVPRLKIREARGEPSATSAVIRYLAPTEDRCRVEAIDGAGASAPAVSDNGSRAEREVRLGGLKAGSAYRVRITCGPKYGAWTGTVRAQIEVRTP